MFVITEYLKKGTLSRLKGRVPKSPIGDVGSLLWRRRSATLAAKELTNLTREIGAVMDSRAVHLESHVFIL